MTRVSLLFSVDEVKLMETQLGRTGSTLGPFLNTAWTGVGMATQNADHTRTRNVLEHRYRLAVVSGVQPTNADSILSAADSGFPQRWLWMPTYDPEAGREPGGAVPSWDWPVLGAPVVVDADGVITYPPLRVMGIPDAALDAIKAAYAANNVPIDAAVSVTTALDSHAVLNRLKVAALFALLDVRTDESDDDWRLAGVVLEVSDLTRTQIQRVLARESSERQDYIAVRAGRTAAITDEARRETKVSRAASGLRRWLATHEGEHPEGALRRAIRFDEEAVFEAALALLVEGGELVDLGERTARNGQTARYYRTPGGGEARP
jgi:hypothetical protein